MLPPSLLVRRQAHLAQKRIGICDGLKFDRIPRIAVR
jgi:hypothetical protein